MRSPVFASVPTQTNIKQRWPDGSVKHAIMCAMVEGQGGKLDVVEGVPVIGNPDPQMHVFLSINGEMFEPAFMSFEEHFAGPFCTSRTYGNGKHPGQGNAFIQIDYYHAIGLSLIFIRIENTNTEAVTEFKPEIIVVVGGEEVFHSNKPPDQSFVMGINSCYPMEFEYNPLGVKMPNVAFDTPYLISTGAIPPFDMSVQLEPAAIDTLYARWQSSNKNILDRWSHEWGLFDRHQGNAGARSDIGPFPSWSTQLLYSWDPRCWEMELGNAKLAMQYACSIREGNPANAHYGEPVSIWDRPTCQLSRLTTLNVLPEADSWELQPDPAHQPNPFYLSYLLTGSNNWLEMMKLWNAYNAGYSNGAGIAFSYGRGPTGREGGIPGANGAAFQIRGEGWVARARAELTWIIPDDDSMRQYFLTLMDDMFVIWEGKLGINKPADLVMTAWIRSNDHQIADIPPRLISGDPRWFWGNTIDKQDSPLHFWDYGNGGLAHDDLDEAKCRSGFSPWELSGMFCYALNRMDQLGYPVKPIKAHIAPCLLAMGKYLAAYRMATKDENETPFNYWPDVIDCYTPNFDIENWWQTQRGTEQGYVVMAGQGVQATGDAAAFQQYKADVYDMVNFRVNPKWKIIW